MGQSRSVVMIKVVREAAVGDACPLCGVTLGQPRGATRRQIILSPRPGLFCWRCPDCRGVWAVHSVRPAHGEDPQAAPGTASQSGTPVRSPAGGAPRGRLARR